MEQATVADKSSTGVLALAAQLVSAYIGTHQIQVAALPELIQSVYRSLAMAGMAEPTPAPPTPAVPIRKSVFPAYIVCLEDGKQLKMLRRYLRVRYGMTPEQYRQRWGLPADYPMVAPNYSNHRSSFAKRIGFGRRPASLEQVNLVEVDKEPELPAEPPVTRGRARRARGHRG